MIFSRPSAPGNRVTENDRPDGGLDFRKLSFENQRGAEQRTKTNGTIQETKSSRAESGDPLFADFRASLQ